MYSIYTLFVLFLYAYCTFVDIYVYYVYTPIILGINKKYFGFPLYFFRASYTTAVQNVPMVKVKWIPYNSVHSYRASEIGLITVDNWQATEYENMNNDINPFISFQQLEPTRYALSFISIKETDVYVSMAFIALDGDNLGDGIQIDPFCMDYGDNILTHYLGSNDNDEEDEEDLIPQQYDNLKKLIPPSVLEYLTAV